MSPEVPQKVATRHLERDAYLYVRQSSLRQVVENTESTERQYALRERAVALGWPRERIHVIDTDQGHSGASTADRDGFQKLVADVGLGRAGIVLGLEVSRLARNCADWHRLLEICGLTDTLLLDEDGLYDPASFNDRLVLGLKGTMSEAELHYLRARLRGGVLNKARRGELRTPVPVGLVYDAADRVQLDPDQQVQAALRHAFETFRRAGSALAVVKDFREQGLRFPRRLGTGPRKGELVWGPLGHSRVLHVLHNPRYAGAFFFGRWRSRRRPDGTATTRLMPRQDWHVLLPDTHPGYIPWAEYEDNQRRLRECAQARGADRRQSPPREGPALLQGLVLCGRCGDRMTVHYETQASGPVPVYSCQRLGIATATPFCQRLQGAAIDTAVGALLLETVTPATLEVALEVQEELQHRLAEADRLRQQQVERARYEAELARQRYLQVDPANRLVADALEADWNARLRALAEAQDEYERLRATDARVLSDEQRARILALATDFPRLWRDPRTPQRERKRMARLLIADVALRRDQDQIHAEVRFKGGTTRSLAFPRPKSAAELCKTPPAVVAEVDRLLDAHTDGEIASLLNARGLVSGAGKRFHWNIVRRIRESYGLKSRYARLRAAGMLSIDEIAAALEVSRSTVKKWRAAGLLHAHRYNDKNQRLYELPGEDHPTKQPGRKLSERRNFPTVAPHATPEV